MIYRDELALPDAGDPTVSVTRTITREPPPGWTGYQRRIDAGHEAAFVKTERFGSTGQGT